MALGNILLGVLVLTLVVFTALSASLSHLHMASASTRQEHARNLAEAALAETLTKLLQSDFEFGRNGTDGVEVTVAGLPDGKGVVSFDPGQLPDHQSTNNSDSDSDAQGAGDHVVPARTVHLVARGQVGSAISWMECVYFKPPFPDGLAASGPVEANALYLAGVRQARSYPGGDPAGIPDEELIPANLFSNADQGLTDGQAAAEVGPGSLIKGTAGAVGTVAVDPESVVEGEVLPNSNRRAIPQIDIRERINALRPNAVALTYSGGNLTLNPNWFSRNSGSLSVTGDLILNGSALLVEGNLEVSGAITGTGIILVDGEVILRGGRSNVVSTDQVAIASTGDFELAGNSPDTSYFQGLVYCEGNLKARNITVVGATVVNGQDGAIGSAELDNVRFVLTPGSVSLELSRVEGNTIGRHSWAYSLSLRPDPQADDPGDFLCDARAYFTDIQIGDGTVNHQQKDNPAVWNTWALEHNDRFAMWDSVSGNTTVKTESGTTTQAGTAYADGMPVRLTASGELVGRDGEPNPMRQTLFDFFTTQAEFPVGSGEDGNYDTRVNALLDEQLRRVFQQDTYSLSFNLNNLLGELSGSSRVLLWRPYRELEPEES